MEIRYLQDCDKDDLCKLSYQINSEHYQREPAFFCRPVEEGDDWEFWKNSHEKEGGFVLVAAIEDELVGFVSAALSEMPNIPFLNPIKRCKISTIVVSKNHHRRGIGTALFNRVIELASKQGASEVNLEVFSFNTSAQAFYEHLGFRNSSKIMSKPIA